MRQDPDEKRTDRGLLAEKRDLLPRRNHSIGQSHAAGSVNVSHLCRL
jgi:hypothetical protein